MEKIKNKMLNYYRIRDIVNDVYVNYIREQTRVYHLSERVGFQLAEESVTLIMDILNNKPDMTDGEIRALAYMEANSRREWN